MWNQRVRKTGGLLLVLCALASSRAAADSQTPGAEQDIERLDVDSVEADGAFTAPDTTIPPNALNPVASASPEEAQRPHGELAGLPAVAGNDIFGLLVGITGSYTRFAPDYRPFRFRAQLTAVTSIKGSDSGVRFPLQNIDLRLDFPGLFSHRVRVYALLRYQRILDVGYWGLGNGASGDIPRDYTGPRDRFFNYEKQLGEGRLFVRYRLLPQVDLVSGVGVRLVLPQLVEDSRLARDLASNAAASSLLVGYTDHQIYDALLGVLFDTRDDEFNPSRGGYHELSVRGGAGPSNDREILYGALYLHTRWFFPFPDERLVLAVRALTDVGVGSMPLLELGTIGGYTSMPGPAGIEANRGLPYGRQLGRVKVLATTELRSTFYHFSAFDQEFGLGAAVFVDASRVWAQLAPSPELDDGGPLLRFSFGGGPRLIWGRGLVLRVDVGFGPWAAEDGAHNVSASLALGHTF